MPALCGTVRYPQDRRVRVQYSTSSDLLPSILHKQNIVLYPIRVAVALRCHRGFASVESQSGVSSIRRGCLLECGSIRVTKGPSYDTNQRSHTTIKRIAVYIDGACRPFVGGSVLWLWRAGFRYDTVSITPSHGTHSHTSLRYDLVTVRRADIISYHIILSIMRACITVECSK